MAVLAKATSLKEVSDIILTEFERPADTSDAVKTKRAGYGQTYLDQFGKAETTAPAAPVETTFTPYLVQVTTDYLNIRKTPGTDSKLTGAIRDRGVYTIVDESSGTGATKWGKLKSGAGWIALDFTKKMGEVK